MLITGAEVPAGFLRLYREIGISPAHRVAQPHPSDPGAAVEERLLTAPDDDLRGYGFSPYAVLPETARLVAAYGLAARPPDAGTVRKVSSKSWSSALLDTLGLPGGGVIVGSVGELLTAVAQFGDHPVLLKDPYGVGGRGILEVSSPRALRTVCRVLSAQVARGLRVELLVQPRWDRAADFSAQFRIDSGGRLHWHGVVVIENAGFSHVGTRPPDPEFQRRLDEAGYASIIADVGAALADAGYHGPVDVDSMLLRDGTLVPLLEINPRMSVGLIGILAGARLTGPATTARLAVRPVRSADTRGTFDAVLALMREHRVLFTPGGTGLLPLAANTLRTSRGRLHCIVVSGNAEEDRRLGTALDLITRLVSEQAAGASRAS
ncbi:hypothetical protein [Amycolatopsis sacchari]|uniref:hypothetical protein n=1 Tax=Amycolatopsis sacchari TaxID=115433 RepID=UPI003D71381D